MHFHDPYKKNSTVTTQVTCAIVFWLFSWSWLYWFQADVLAIAQHVLSEGVTKYDRVIGAFLITFALQLVQFLVLAVVRLRRFTHALTYTPSMLLLALFSTGYPVFSDEGHIHATVFIVVGLLLVWGVWVWLSRHVPPFGGDKQPSGILSRRVWVNMSIFVLMMACVVVISNTHAVMHYRAHAEVALQKGDVDEALRVGMRSLETDAHLTQLRAYALARRGEMAERLFTYPVEGNGEDLLPLQEVRPLLLPSDSIFRLCGALPIDIHDAHIYLNLLEADSLATPASFDYRLCGLLIDRKLDAFAHFIGKYYPSLDSLPRHYREALTIYIHQRSHPVLEYHHPVSDEDWSDFQKLRKKYSSKAERKQKVAERYFGSYWFYYYYGRP